MSMGLGGGDIGLFLYVDYLKIGLLISVFEKLPERIPSPAVRKSPV